MMLERKNNGGAKTHGKDNKEQERDMLVENKVRKCLKMRKQGLFRE